MMSRTVSITCAVVVGSALAATSTVMVGDIGARQHPGLWILAISQGLLVLAFIGFARRRASASDTAYAILLATIGLVAASTFAWGGEPQVSKEAVRLLPFQAMQAQLVVAAMIMRRRRWALLTLASTVLGTVWLTSLGDPSVPSVHLKDCVLPVGCALAGMILVRGLRQAALDANRLSERRRDVRVEVIAASNAQLADDEGRRVVHDQVLSALAAIEAGRDPVVVSSACQVALNELNMLDPTTSAASLREALQASDHPEVPIDGAGWPMSPPPRVVSALRESAREAIRNAGRHAGVDEVTVQLTSTRHGQAAVVVQDSGRGFDPDELAGFGLSQSIMARMGQAGGEARIESYPGMGTTVRLLWPRRSSLRVSPDAGVLAPYGRSELYLRMVIPVVIAVVYVAGSRAPDDRLHTAGLGLSLVLALLFFVSAYYIGRVIRPSWTFVVAIALANAVIMLAALSLASPNTLLTFKIWAVTGCSMVAGLVAMAARPLHVVFITFVEVATIIAVAVQTPHLGTLEPVGALLTPIAAAGAGYAMGAVLRRGSRLVAVQEALSKAEMEEAGWAQSAETARRHYAGALQANVAPFLEYCAADRPASTEPLGTRASALAAECRDLLAMSDAMPATVRQAVLNVRNQGVRVAIRDAPSVSPVAWALLVAALRHAARSDAVTLIPAREGTPARVTVIPRVSAVAEATIREELDGQTIWIEHTDVTTSFIVVSPQWGTSTHTD
jgi:signal transduction histidine kinase